MRTPRETVVYDSTSECPYLPGQTARLPLRMPVRKLTGAEFDARLASGDRRCGSLLYGTQCPNCQACEPIRIDVERFGPSRSQQRAWKRGQAAFHTVVGKPRVDETRVALFNRHKHGRGLEREDSPIDELGYQQFLVDTCCETQEIAYYHQHRLAMVAILDCGASSASAVYTFYDPSLGRLSPGVFSVLNEIEYCRATGRRYLYLGYYIAASEHMAYKALYQPHERLIGGAWQAFD